MADSWDFGGRGRFTWSGAPVIAAASQQDQVLLLAELKQMMTQYLGPSLCS
jgi:hypothetical protein